jgi:2,3-bisphosphoglycerate-independent phosphoglycerate mutase
MQQQIESSNQSVNSCQHIKKILLIILDGFGIRENPEFNAIAAANMLNWNYYTTKYAFGTLDASGLSVGLPSGQFGNSEVGHLNIGAGRVVMQDITRINDSIVSGEFYKNPALLRVLDTTTSGTVHIMGLLSDGGVHAHIEHIIALIKFFSSESVKGDLADSNQVRDDQVINKGNAIKQIFLHIFLDGRDTPPKSAVIFLAHLENVLKQYPVAKIATLGGRYYAMDRDRRYDRIQLAYDAIVGGGVAHDSDSSIYDVDTRDGETHVIHTAPLANSAIEVINESYAHGITDEFIKPHVIDGYTGFKDGDSVIFANFRSDRATQLTDAISGECFEQFKRFRVKLANFVTMTQYDAKFSAIPVFSPNTVYNTLGEYIAGLGYSQLRIAETEKYPHITYFFNGGKKEPYLNEERILISSPRDVATYDLKPEMSLPEVTDKLVAAIALDKYELIVTNFANCDMVGHSGDLAATTKAVEAVDIALGRCIKSMLDIGGEVLVIADHGNCEEMFDIKSHQVHTQHTTNPVPCLYIGRPATIKSHGTLQDVAPTLLAMAGLPKPAEMTGKSVINLV